MKRQVRFPQKLVPFLQDEIESACSGKFLRRLLEANLCRVNGRVERFGSTQLQKGDVVELAPSWKELESPSRVLKWEILFEDDETRWVNKPAGWVCSPEECTLAFGAGIQLIHRLDKETTGVLGLAKSKQAMERWKELFAKRVVEKQYLALVDGVPIDERGVRKSYLSKKGSFQGQTIWGSASRGLEAITHWSTLRAHGTAALLLCQPVTGRTHQIRVHLAEMGHPILVDRQYADRFRSPFFAKRPLLHASKLQVGDFQVEAPLPSDLCDALRELRIEHT